MLLRHFELSFETPEDILQGHNFLSRCPISCKPPEPRGGVLSLPLTIRLLPRRANPRRYELENT